MPPPQGSWNPIEGPGDYTFTSQVHNTSYPAISPSSVPTPNFLGKTIVVIGASKGLGRHIALSYAAAGASNIAIAARSDLSAVEKDMLSAAEKAGRKEHPSVLKLKLDITDQESVRAAAKAVEKEWGVVDVLVNNAAVFKGRGLVGESDAEEWWECMNANVRGPYLTIQAFLPLILKSDLKTVATVSSVGAHVVSPTASAYQTSKLAVLRLSEFVAKEYADQGLISFAVHPGNILTDIVGNGEGMDEKFKAIFTETPELCGDSLVFLTKEKRQWLSGRYINCTWDLPELTSDPKKTEIIEGDKLKVRLVI